MWIRQHSAYFKFIPSTHTHTCMHARTHKHTHTHTHINTHTHTHTLIPFEDGELTGLKVDIATTTKVKKNELKAYNWKLFWLPLNLLLSHVKRPVTYLLHVQCILLSTCNPHTHTQEHNDKDPNCLQQLTWQASINKKYRNWT